MRSRRDIAPYMFSADLGVNASLSFGKIRKRIRMVNPAYRPSSFYRARLLHRRAARRAMPGIVRP